MVRTKNAMPEAWWRQRKARVVRFEFAGLRPWMWFASPFLPFVSTWEDTHFRHVSANGGRVLGGPKLCIFFSKAGCGVGGGK